MERLSDEHAGVSMPKAVEGKPSLPSRAGAFDRQPEDVIDMAVIAPATRPRGETRSDRRS